MIYLELSSAYQIPGFGTVTAKAWGITRSEYTRKTGKSRIVLSLSLDETKDTPLTDTALIAHMDGDLDDTDIFKKLVKGEWTSESYTVSEGNPFAHAKIYSVDNGVKTEITIP